MARPDMRDRSETEETDAQRVERCRAGDALAFESLYARHVDDVYRMARWLGTPMQELDDVTQQVFVNAFKNLHRFHGGDFGHWLHAICANVATDHHRRRRVREAFGSLFRSQPDDEREPGPTPEGLLERAEAEQQVVQILSRMKPKHREVFVLFELERLSGEEIASRLRIPTNTVWTRLHHARRSFVHIGSKRGFLEPGGVE